jgi:hypothetical protein
MNHENLEQELRKLPAPELPERWRAEILSTALRAARAADRPRQIWPPLLICLRNLFARNPWTASALTALWILILLFKVGTPIDPAEKELIARFDPNRPIHLLSLRDEIMLAELLQEQPEQRQIQQIP